VTFTGSYVLSFGTISGDIAMRSFRRGAGVVDTDQEPSPGEPGLRKDSSPPRPVPTGMRLHHTGRLVLKFTTTQAVGRRSGIPRSIRWRRTRPAPSPRTSCPATPASTLHDRTPHGASPRPFSAGRSASGPAPRPDSPTRELAVHGANHYVFASHPKEGERASRLPGLAAGTLTPPRLGSPDAADILLSRETFCGCSR
jgi:hypothetical protein